MDLLSRWRSRRKLEARQRYRLLRPADGEGKQQKVRQDQFFSWREYWSFLMIGVAMMWTWMTILTAVPYLQKRFQSHHWIRSHFESCILIVFAITLLGVTLVLTRPSPNVSYPNRLHSSFVTCIAISSLLSISAISFVRISSGGYFIFLLTAVFFTALANGLCQNAVFAFVANFGHVGYTQAVVTGQAIAGIMPPFIEVISAVSIPQARGRKSRKYYATSIPTLIYFLSGVLINGLALIALAFLRKSREGRLTIDEVAFISSRLEDEGERSSVELKETYMSSPIDHHFRKPIRFRTLWRKLAWPSASLFLCLSLSSIYPVFASAIVSVSAWRTRPKLLQPEAYIPLAFGIWNIGELIGSLLSILPSPTSRPRLIFMMSAARIGFIPLYRMCNVNGGGATISSDVFYLFVVQLLFGVTEGWLGGICMVGISEWVEEDEREAAGAFMGLMTVIGMAVGSFLSLAAI